MRSLGAEILQRSICSTTMSFQSSFNQKRSCLSMSWTNWSSTSKPCVSTQDIWTSEFSNKRRTEIRTQSAWRSWVPREMKRFYPKDWARPSSQSRSSHKQLWFFRPREKLQHNRWQMQNLVQLHTRQSRRDNGYRAHSSSQDAPHKPWEHLIFMIWLSDLTKRKDK